MTSQTAFVASPADIDRIVRQARAVRAATLRGGVLRLFAAFRSQAAH